MKKKQILLSVLVVVVALVGWRLYSRVRASAGSGGPGRAGVGPAPVALAPIEHGPMVETRVFSGSLESPAEFVVAAKVGGRVERLTVDVADRVTRGQVVASLDDDEFQQAVVQAEAEVEVTKANLAEANSGFEIAERELSRVVTLGERGVASESDLDIVRADHLAKKAATKVAEARVSRAEAALAAARIRLGYTTVTADWSTSGGGERVVAERYVDEGHTVSANTPLVSIVELNPMNAIFYVTEQDYSNMKAGQAVSLTTDAYPGQTFTGRVTRVAPAFQTLSRQARVELTIPNDQLLLRPGMFVKVSVVMATVDDAVVVPEQALTKRADRVGLFLVDLDELKAHWREVTVGIREKDRVQLLDTDLSGYVITLGQHMVDDGSPVTIPESKELKARDGDAL